jgi:UDP-N-acetyl-D-galactosamine dehydrogenase
VRDSRVVVLGLTFKENVPDLRNTRVTDIIHELEDYGVQVQVHDALADAAEAREEYGIELYTNGGLEPADAVVLAVAHGPYLEGGWGYIQGLLKDGEGVVADVKGMLPREAIPAGVDLWRL